MSVGVVGAGLLGLTTAYRLAKEGVPVRVYEASDRVGGLAGTSPLDGIEVDRYYHAVTLTDQRVIDLATELGLGDSIRWRPLGVGFFHDGALASMTTPRELLRFPGLSAADRARLVAFVARCRFISDQAALDDEPIEPWTRRMAATGSGRGSGGRCSTRSSTAASTIFPPPTCGRACGARPVRGTARAARSWAGSAAATRRSRTRCATRYATNGGEVLTGEPVRSILSTEGRVQGVVVGDGFRPHDWVVSTLLRPHLSPMLGAGPPGRRSRRTSAATSVWSASWRASGAA